MAIRLGIVAAGLMFLVCGRSVPAGEAPKADLDARFAAFLKKPSAKNYLAVFKQVTSSPKYQPYSRVLDEVKDLLDKKQNKEALKKIDGAMPGLLLSPKAHLYASVAAVRLNDKKRAEKELLAQKQCLQGMLNSGDGSQKKPYLVTCVSDQYDLLRHLRKAVKMQGLRQDGGKSYDMIFCTDGSEIWFDITTVFASLRRSIKKPDKKPKSD